MSYTVPANTLATNGDHLVMEAAGTFANTAQTKTLKAYWNGVAVYDSAAGAAGQQIPVNLAGHWHLRMIVIRTGAATQKVITSVSTSASAYTWLATYTTGAATLSGTVVMKLTATSSTNNNNISQELMTVQWRPNNT